MIECVSSSPTYATPAEWRAIISSSSCNSPSSGNPSIKVAAIDGPASPRACQKYSFESSKVIKCMLGGPRRLSRRWRGDAPFDDLLLSNERLFSWSQPLETMMGHISLSSATYGVSSKTRATEQPPYKLEGNPPWMNPEFLTESYY